MENNKHSWNSVQMDKFHQEFESLIATANLNYEHYSPEEQAAIIRAVTRYNESVVYTGIDDIKDNAIVLYNEIARIIEEAPSHIDRFADDAIEIIDTIDFNSLNASIEKTNKSIEEAAMRIERKLEEKMGEKSID